MRRICKNAHVVYRENSLFSTTVAIGLEYAVLPLAYQFQMACFHVGKRLEYAVQL